MSEDGWSLCVCVCGPEGGSEQKATYEGVVTKEKASWHMLKEGEGSLRDRLKSAFSLL